MRIADCEAPYSAAFSILLSPPPPSIERGKVYLPTLNNLQLMLPTHCKRKGYQVLMTAILLLAVPRWNVSKFITALP
jgi:hypothetical protein